MEDEKKPIYTEQKIDVILEMVTDMYKVLMAPDARISVDEIARYWGVNKRSLYGARRYLLPDFGRTEEKGKHRTYTRKEFQKWAAIGRDELKRRWKTLGN